MAGGDENPLRPEHFARVDESLDALFYDAPRLVTHIDDAAIDAAAAFYTKALPQDGRILDLMTSWVSHLPSGRFRAVSGLGMNEEELDQNPLLTERLLQDLNLEPRLPWPDATFDGAIVTVSVQYLTRPIEVFAEVGRVLKPGAQFLVTYSNRMFPTKAVAIWRSLNDHEHADLIGLYFRLSGRFEGARAYDLSPAPGRSDPLYAVGAAARATGAED